MTYVLIGIFMLVFLAAVGYGYRQARWYRSEAERLAKAMRQNKIEWIACGMCGKAYDYYTEDFCPRCGDIQE